MGGRREMRVTKPKRDRDAPEPVGEPADPLPPVVGTTAQERYIARIRDALTLTNSREMPLADYIAALEEIAADIEGMIDAAREESGE